MFVHLRLAKTKHETQQDKKVECFTKFYLPKCLQKIIYRIVTGSNTSRLEAHLGIYRLLMKRIFDAYVLWPFDEKLIS